jgi:hypothetical protein
MAKGLGLVSFDRGKSEMEQQSCYATIAVIILVTSLLYMAFSVRMLMGYSTSFRYPMEAGVVIAAITFSEIAWNIRGAVLAKRNHGLIIQAIRLTSLASSMICLVLTQTAILSFAYPGDASAANGLSGIIFGGCAAFIGVYMLMNINRIKQQQSSETGKSSQGG